MLIFSTKLYIKDELNNNLFIRKVLKWAGESPNYSFSELDWDDDKEEFIEESKDRAQTLTIMKYEESVIVDLVNRDDKVIWTNDYVLTQRGGKKILSVQLYSETEDVSAKFPTTFNRPRLLKTIINDGYGDLDGDLDTGDKCLVISEDNLDIVKKIILNEKEYMMPVVYVTPTLHTSNFKLDYNELAKDLAGVAHVLVEKDSNITNKLKKLTDGKNPYNAGVQIYFGKGVSQRILPKYKNNTDFRQEVAYAVFRKLILEKIDDDLSPTKIRLSKIIKSNVDNEELCQTYDTILRENEKELEICKNRISELEDTINEKEVTITYLQHRMSKSSKNKESNTVLIIPSQEYDLYEDEQKDLILKIIKRELEKMEDDDNLKETRKYHILKSIIQQNKITNASENIIKQIRKAIPNDFKMNPTSKRNLVKLGFKITEGNHYKIIYKNDNRYCFTVAKTSSDSRSNQNLRSSILKNLFNTNE